MAINSYAPENQVHKFDDTQSYAKVMKEIGLSTKDLFQSEVNLLITEFKQTGEKLGRDLTQAALFGGLLALSILPFMAFLVIGLGILLEGQYWLSSLIVSVVFALIGGPLAYRAIKKVKEKDLTLPRTRAALEDQTEIIKDKTKDISDAVTKGEKNESH